MLAGEYHLMSSRGVCFRIALAARGPGRRLRTEHGQPRVLPARAPGRGGGRQVPGERPRHPLGLCDVRLSRSREHTTVTPGKNHFLFCSYLC